MFVKYFNLKYYFIFLGFKLFVLLRNESIKYFIFYSIYILNVGSIRLDCEQIRIFIYLSLHPIVRLIIGSNIIVKNMRTLQKITICITFAKNICIQNNFFPKSIVFYNLFIERHNKNQLYLIIDALNATKSSRNLRIFIFIFEIHSQQK